MQNIISKRTWRTHWITAITRWFSPIILQPLSDKITRLRAISNGATIYYILSCLIYVIASGLENIRQIPPGRYPWRFIIYGQSRNIRVSTESLACLVWTIPCLRKISTSISRARVEVYKYKISQSNYLSASLPWHCTRELKQRERLAWEKYTSA